MKRVINRFVKKQTLRLWVLCQQGSTTKPSSRQHPIQGFVRRFNLDGGGEIFTRFPFDVSLLELSYEACLGHGAHPSHGQDVCLLCIWKWNWCVPEQTAAPDVQNTLFRGAARREIGRALS